MFKYTLDNKRYHTLNYYLKNKYHEKVFKVSVNGGFSCPNNHSCIYCSESGSGEFAGNKNDDLVTQFNKVKENLHKKWPKAKYIGYFQANTNTYDDVNNLKEKYETILKQPNVVGLSIATRPDAFNEKIFTYLEELNKKTDLTIELGLQSIHNETLKFIKRGHNLDCFINCFNELKKRNIRVVVHIINGLPYETRKMMIETVKFLNELGIDGIKIHMLYITKKTELHEIYKKEHFHVLTKEEYIDIVTEQLKYLDPKIVIERITGDPVSKDLIEPTWLLKKFCVLNDIDKKMYMNNIYQGDNVIHRHESL